MAFYHIKTVSRTYIAFVRSFNLTVSRLLLRLNVLVRVLGSNVLGGLEIGTCQGRCGNRCSRLDSQAGILPSRPERSYKESIRPAAASSIYCLGLPCPVKQRLENTGALAVLTGVKRHDGRDIGMATKKNERRLRSAPSFKTHLYPSENTPKHHFW